MHGTKTSSAYLILDDVLVDVVLSSAVTFIIRVSTLGIECLLDHSNLRSLPSVMPQGTMVCGRRAVVA